MLHHPQYALRVLSRTQRRARRETKEKGTRKRKKRLTAYDYYELFVGEIGLSRREFLYDIKFWEARRILRGYRKRHHFLYQLIAEDVFASTYAFRGS